MIPLLVVILSLTVMAPQPERTRTETLARRASDRLQALHREAERLASDERTLLNELRTLEVQRQIKVEELRQVDADAAKAASALADIDHQVQRLERQEQEARPELRSRLVEIYKLGRGRYVRLLLSTSDMRRLGQAARMVAVM